jgi:hypothetical protein
LISSRPRAPARPPLPAQARVDGARVPGVGARRPSCTRIFRMPRNAHYFFGVLAGAAIVAVHAALGSLQIRQQDIKPFTDTEYQRAVCLDEGVSKQSSSRQFKLHNRVGDWAGKLDRREALDDNFAVAVVAETTFHVMMTPTALDHLGFHPRDP